MFGAAPSWRIFNVKGTNESQNTGCHSEVVPVRRLSNALQ